MNARHEPQQAQSREAPDRGFLATAVAVAVLALVPYPGAWKLLQQLLPIALVAAFYRLRRYSAARAGLGRPQRSWWRLVALAAGLAVLLYAARALLLSPLLRALFPGGKDLSLFAGLEGSLPTLVLYLVFMWIFAAFGEELLWRGFLLREIGERAPVKHPWLLAIAVSAALFGVAHAYQGAYGVAEKSVSAFVTGAIYLWSGRSSIWLVMLIHGFQNTISFVALYFGVYDTINFPG